MPMPSLFKYFAFVGAALFGLLSLANFLLDPSTGATPVATAPAKQTVAVQHDPRASKIERWRDDQVALKAAQQTQTTQNASLATKSVAEPPRPMTTNTTTAAVEQPQPQPAPQVAAAAPVPAQPQPAAAPTPPAPETAAIVGAESTDEIAAARAAKVAERKAKIAKAKARKERLARQTTARERYASNQQDQFYYGRQQQPLVTNYSSAFAPQQSFGPFSGGWGRSW
ncbi:MAG: hypothetical protein JO000_05330 [Alphaproteobacteria bacterium]|nr:hypothetical protein [Alphaproteobacteria bacterium]